MKVKIPGIQVNQREETGCRFFVCAVLASEVQKWARVDRVSERKGGVQRALSRHRKRALSRFLADERNVIPTAAVLAALPDRATFASRRSKGLRRGTLNVESEWLEFGVLSFEYFPDSGDEEEEKPLFIVDGQHRIFGAAEAKQEVPLLLSILVDADTTEQAFQFVVINNKSAKVAPDLVRSLLVDFNDEDLNERLLTARLNVSQSRAIEVAVLDSESDSPFYKMVRWPAGERHGDSAQCLTPRAVEQSILYLSRQIPELREDANDDLRLEVFKSLWKGVKSAYADSWKTEEVPHLFENAGFRSLSELLVDGLSNLISFDVFELQDFEAIEACGRKIAEQVGVEFWRVTWHMKGLDTAAGRQIVQDAINLVRSNRKNGIEWNENVKLLRPKKED